jgi:iron complex outermembrane receptor protein
MLVLLARGSALAGPSPKEVRIEVVVRDQSGAAVRGARVELQSAPARLALTGDEGVAVFTGLPVGLHQLKITCAGFIVEERAVDLAAAAGARLEVSLRLAPSSESLTIVAGDVAVQALLRIPSTVHETPRSLTVVGSGQMRERNFRSINDALNFIPGMSVNSYRTGGYHFYARGYRMVPEDTRVDGMTGINAGGGYGASLFGIEDAVVLRGPAGLLYGSSSAPGGMINLITKKPGEDRATRIDLRNGTYAGSGVGKAERPSLSADIDSTGALLPNRRILYRGLATLENQNYFTGGTLDRNRYIQGALTFRLDSQSRYTLTPIAQRTWFNRPAGGGIVASPTTSLTTNDGLNRVNFADLSPVNVNFSLGNRIDDGSQAGFDFRAIPDARWSSAFSYRRISLDTYISQFTPVVATGAQIALLRERNEMLRQLSKSETGRAYHNFDANTSYEFRPASWLKNTMQIGGYTRIVSQRSTTAQGPVPGPHSPINIYTGAAGSPLVDNYPALKFNPWSNTTTWNGYLQNRSAAWNDRVVFTLGLGYGQNHPGGAPVQKSKLIPNASLVYSLKPEIAVYGSYSTSFNPQSPTLEDISGNRNTFDPTLGKNYEFGARYDLPGRRATMAIAWFRTEIANALVLSGPADLNPNGNRYYSEVGSRRSRGVELSSEFRPAREWFISAAGSFLNAIYTGEGPSSATATLPIPGTRAEKSPRWAANGRIAHTRTRGRFAGFGWSTGLLWQEKRTGGNGAATPSAPDPLLFPAYSRWDASLSYRLEKHWDFALNLENLLDEVILVNGTVGSSIERAAPRALTLRIGYSF